MGAVPAAFRPGVVGDAGGAGAGVGAGAGGGHAHYYYHHHHQQQQQLHHQQQQQHHHHQYLHPHARPSAPMMMMMTTSAPTGAAPTTTTTTTTEVATRLPPPPLAPGDAYLAKELEHEEGMVDLLTAAIERAVAGGFGGLSPGMAAFPQTTTTTTTTSAMPAPVLPDWNHPASVFFSVKVPEISVRAYVGRLCKYAQCSPTAFLIALVYMKRLALRDPTLVLSHYNLHRLLITTLCVGAKFLDDRCFSNALYARVGGIPSVKEMNRLELHVMKILDYRMFVSSTEFSTTQKDVLLLAYDASPRRSLPDVRPLSPHYHQEPPYSPVTASSPESVVGLLRQEISPVSSEGYDPYANVVSPPFYNGHMHYEAPRKYIDRSTGYVNCPTSYASTCVPAAGQTCFTRTDPAIMDPYPSASHLHGFVQQQQLPLHQATTLYRPHHAHHASYVRPGQAHGMGKARSFAGQTGPAMLYSRAPPPSMQTNTSGYTVRSFQAVNS